MGSIRTADSLFCINQESAVQIGLIYFLFSPGLRGAKVFVLRSPQITDLHEHLSSVIQEPPTRHMQQSRSVRVAGARDSETQSRIDVFQIAVISGVDRGTGMHQVGQQQIEIDVPGCGEA